MDRVRAPLLIVLLVTTLAGCHLPGRFMRGYAEADPEGMELLSEQWSLRDGPVTPSRSGALPVRRLR